MNLKPGITLLSNRRMNQALAATAVAMFALIGHSQDWEFGYDGSGNLLFQSPENITLPQILAQPQPQVVQPGELASFFIVVADTRNLTYQWRFNGIPLGGSATNDALLLTNVSTNNEGQYSVVLVNGSGSVTSAPAALMIDGDGDGMPDSWEITYFGNLSQTATGDFDHDGVSNLQEFLDGTNPTNSASVLYQLVLAADGGLVTASPNGLRYTNGAVVTLTASVSPPGLFRGWAGDIITTNNPATVTMNANKTVFAYLGSSYDLTWTNRFGGDWNAQANWSPNVIPTTNDNVMIAINGGVTLSADREIRDLTLGSLSTSPTLTGSGTLTLHGTSSWISGFFSGGGTTVVAPGATFNLANTGNTSIDSRKLENGGTIIWTGTDIGLLNGVVITNRVGALFEAQNTAAFNQSFGTSSRFDNAGTFRKSLNPGTNTIGNGIPFNNYGAVEVQTGALRISGGGSANGVFTVPATAQVEWNSGSFTLDPSAQLNGNGLYRVVSSATLTCNANMALAKLDLLGGTLTGSGTVIISNQMNWTAGTMSGSGQTVISPGATLNMVVVPSQLVLNGRVLENGGAILTTGSGGVTLTGGAVITNRAGALFEVQSSPPITAQGGACRFDNAGTLRKSVDSGTIVFNAFSLSTLAFNNYGTVDLQAGTLQFNVNFLNPGSVTLSPDTTNQISGGGSANGVFTAPATSLVVWNGNSYTLDPGAQLNGSGLYRVVSGATLTCNANVAPAKLDLLGGTLTGSGTVIVSNLMNWTAGTMSGSASTVIAPGATANLGSSSQLVLTGRVLENAGTILATGSGGLALVGGAVITNRAGALFELQSSPTIFASGGPCRFDNAGTFRKSVDAGTVTFGLCCFATLPFNNYGIVDIQRGILAVNGGYNSSSGALLKCALGGTTAGTGYGQLQVGNSITLNGGISINLLSGFLPATNDTFTVVSAGSRSGAFGSFSYPANRVTMQLSNTPNSVLLSVTGVLPIPLPVLLQPQLIGSNVLLTWTATSNLTYRLESNPDLTLSNWNTLPGDVTTLSNIASKLDLLTPSNRFYRVHVLP